MLERWGGDIDDNAVLHALRNGDWAVVSGALVGCPDVDGQPVAHGHIICISPADMFQHLQLQKLYMETD